MAEHTFAGLTCSDVAELAPAFVLGALAPAESDAVRRHLADCPELHAEMAELHSVVPALFEMVERVTPPVDLKQRILAAASADLEARRSAGAQAVTAPAPAAPSPAAEPRAARPVEAPRRGWELRALFRRPVWAAAAAAAVITAVALGAWNVQLRDQLAGLEAYRNGVLEVLDEAAKPGAQIAVLADASGAGGPSGLAAVATDGSVAIVMRDLAPTSGTQVYEAWLIGADGVPVPIGGFRVGGSGSASFVTAHASMGEGVVVALTLEPTEGAKTPTMPIIAVGTARAQAG